MVDNFNNNFYFGIKLDIDGAVIYNDDNNSIKYKTENYEEILSNIETLGKETDVLLQKILDKNPILVNFREKISEENAENEGEIS